MESQIPCLMFFLLAALISPSMAVGCCHPDTIKGTLFYDKSPHKRTVGLIDFSKNKYILRRQFNDGTEYILCDQEIGNCYVRRQDGRCSIIPLIEHLLQCPVENGRELGSFDIMGNVVNMFTVDLGNNRATTRGITRNGCLPVYKISINPSEIVTQFITDVTSPVSIDDLRDLDQDISDCR